MSDFLVFLGLAAIVIGVIAIVRRGFPRLRIANRKQGAAVLAAGFVLMLVGGAIAGPAERIRSSSPSPPPTSPSPSPSPSSSPSPSPTPAVALMSGETLRVIDGDTAEVRLADGRSESVRFIGVDTPEAGRPYSKESTQYTSDRIVGRPIFLELDVEQRDRFGRLLAYVWLAGPAAVDEANIREHMLNARMLIDGFAALLTVPPNVRYVDYFTRYQQEAQSANRGLWTPPPPAQQSSPNCHPSYPDHCIPPPPPDLDCPDIPYRNFRVLHNVPDPDPHGFDGRDDDGIGCET